MPDLLRSVCGTARRVDAQHERLDILVLADLLEGLDDLGSDDAVAFLIGDLAFEIENGYFVFGFRLRAFDLRQLAGGDKVVVFRPGEHAQETIYVLGINEAVHQPCLYLILRRLETHVAVRQGIQLGSTQAARSAYGRFVFVPYTVEVLLRLLTVGIRHRRAEIGLYGGLERTYLEDLHLHTNLLQDAGEVHLLCCQTVPTYLSRRVKHDAVRYGRYVVVGLTVTLRRCQDPFAALLKIKESIADRFGGSRRHI